MYLHGGHALVATTDFITPVCDDPRRFGRIAAANSLSDVWAMGGEPLFALNICCFPSKVPTEVAGEILAGAAEAMKECGAALLGGHSVEDQELKFGLAVVGEVPRDRVLSNDGALVGDRLVLTKPLGTGVLVNGFKFDKLDEAGLEPALTEMGRLNAEAARQAQAHGAHAATDITGFGFAGHALNVARPSGVALRIRFDAIPVHDGFHRLAARGVTTGCTKANEAYAGPDVVVRRELSKTERELLYDPQTSGGLLVSLPADRADSLAETLIASGHRAAVVGEVLDGPARLEVV